MVEVASSADAFGVIVLDDTVAELIFLAMCISAGFLLELRATLRLGRWLAAVRFCGDSARSWSMRSSGCVRVVSRMAHAVCGCTRGRGFRRVTSSCVIECRRGRR